MDGKGQFLNKIVIERPWRSRRYKEVVIRAYDPGAEPRPCVGIWFAFRDTERPRPTLGYRTPGAMFQGSVSNHMDNAGRRPMIIDTQETKQQ
jgi:hypothetical protein